MPLAGPHPCKLPPKHTKCKRENDGKRQGREEKNQEMTENCGTGAAERRVTEPLGGGRRMTTTAHEPQSAHRSPGRTRNAGGEPRGSEYLPHTQKKGDKTPRQPLAAGQGGDNFQACCVAWELTCYVVVT